MRSLPGSSAREEYRAARVQRRHRLTAATGLLLLAAAAAYAARALTAGTGALALVAAGAACLAGAWWLRPAPDPERWLRGAAGEEATARLLDRLPRRKWFVRHDLRIPGSRANLDHLVIGRSGVWVVDTKATRARVRARCGAVRLGGQRLDFDPTRWEAQVVANRLEVPVRALIVVHGRGLRRRGARCGGVRVVPPAALTRRLRGGRRRLSRVDVADLGRLADAVFRPAAVGRHREKGAGCGG